MEIYKNTSEQVAFYNYVNGQLTDLEEVPSATYTLLVGEESSVTGTLSVATGTTGIYTALIPESLTNDEGIIDVEWETESSSSLRSYNVVTPYIDVHELVSISPSGASWEEMKYAEVYARNKIQQATGQTFGLTLTSVTAHGNGTDILPLVKRVEEVRKLYENQLLVIDTEEEIQNFSYPIRVTSTNSAIAIDRDSDIAEWRQTGILDRGHAFTEGYEYKLYGEFGWKRVPEAIKSCSKELISDYFCNDKKWRDSYISKIKSGDWQIEYHPGVFMSTGNSYVDTILSDYIWHRFVVL